MRLIIVRHGKTLENEQGILQSHLPGHLSQEGIAQAQKVALRLKDTRIDHIYTSDLERAHKTADEIAKYHKDASLVVTQVLRERDLGEFQGKRKCDLGWDSKTSLVSTLETELGEDVCTFCYRMYRFINYLVARHGGTDETILLVTHSGTLKALLTMLEGGKACDIATMQTQHNAAINIYDHNAGQWLPVLLDDTRHLVDA